MSVALDRPAARSARLSLRAPWLHIARYALRRRRTAPLAWGLPLAVLSVTVVAIFPSISSSPQLDQLIDSYPDALKEAFGFSAQSFTSPEGYLAGELFSLIAPFACCYFVLHGLAVALRGADQRATLDVVLSTPIRRRQYVAGWFAALALALLGILAVLGILTQAAAAVFGVELAVGSTLAAVVNLWPLAVFAGGVTVLLSALLRGSAAVTGAAAGVLVAMYFVEVLGRISDAMSGVARLSAFHYYGSAIEDGLDAAACLGLTAVGVALAAAGCLFYERRDLRR